MPKDTQPTNGPYAWGNGPKKQGKIARIIKAITSKKKGK